MTSKPSITLLLGALAIVMGILSAFAGWWFMLGGTVGSTFGASVGATVIVLGALMFATGLASIVVGYGLWRSRHWAWSGAFVVFGASIFIDVVSVVFTSLSVVAVVVSVGVAVAAMWLLLQPATRATYGH